MDSEYLNFHPPDTAAVFDCFRAELLLFFFADFSRLQSADHPGGSCCEKAIAWRWSLLDLHLLLLVSSVLRLIFIAVTLLFILLQGAPACVA